MILPPLRCGNGGFVAVGCATRDGSRIQLQSWMGHRRIDETMIYVHVAESHRRDIPESVLAAAAGETDPDRRILKMLGGRGSNVTAASQSPTIQAS